MSGTISSAGISAAGDNRDYTNSLFLSFEKPGLSPGFFVVYRLPSFRGRLISCRLLSIFVENMQIEKCSILCYSMIN